MTQDNTLPKIGAPATRALQSIGVTELQQLTKVTEAELLQYDIIVDFHNLYDATIEEAFKSKALELIETETDLKYKKKYSGLWKKV